MNVDSWFHFIFRRFKDFNRAPLIKSNQIEEKQSIDGKVITSEQKVIGKIVFFSTLLYLLYLTSFRVRNKCGDRRNSGCRYERFSIGYHARTILRGAPRRNCSFIVDLTVFRLFSGEVSTIISIPTPLSINHTKVSIREKAVSLISNWMEYYNTYVHRWMPYGGTTDFETRRVAPAFGATLLPEICILGTIRVKRRTELGARLNVPVSYIKCQHQRKIKDYVCRN